MGSKPRSILLAMRDARIAREKEEMRASGWTEEAIHDWFVMKDIGGFEGIDQRMYEMMWQFEDGGSAFELVAGMEELAAHLEDTRGHQTVMRSLQDAYVLAGEYRKALLAWPLDPGRTSTHQADLALNLRYAVGDAAQGSELIALHHKHPTSFGQDNLERVVDVLTLLSERWECEGMGLLQYAVDRWEAEESDWAPFAGAPAGDRDRVPLQCYCFYACKPFYDEVETLMRQAENAVRDEHGVPRIGEGWVSEMQLYEIVDSLFPACRVLHHYRPDWLEGQEFDIAVPAMKLAVEFMGEQHFVAIDFFGGEEGFQATQERDRRKRAKATQAGWRVVEIRYDERLDAEHICRRLAGIARPAND